MRLTKTLMIFCILALLVLAGCAWSNQMPQGKEASKVTSRPQTASVESALTAAIDAGELVAVYAAEIRSGQDNYLIIKNAYNEVRDYRIEECSGCEIMNELKIKADSHHIIKFKVTGRGDKVITVRDNLNNYYGSATFKVI
jgi:hypothetical protein